MQYRSAKLKYEHLVLAFLVTLGLMGKEPRINIQELIYYKSLVLAFLHNKNIKVNLNVSSKIRKKFEEDFIGTVYIYDSLEYELIYELNSNINLTQLKKQLEDELGTLPIVIYETLTNEDIIGESIKKENYSLKRKHNNQRKYHN